jgi:cytosine/adenosine deaminase-related metal-dependent hydrolase
LKYFSAEQVHNGKSWLPAGTVIETDDAGTVTGIHAQGTIADDLVAYYSGILCPGFINTHCHLELSHMKGIIEEGNTLVPFLKAVMFQRNNFSQKEKEDAITAAIRSLRQNGTVAVGDIANGTDTLAFRENAGLFIHTFIESIGFSETRTDERFAYAENVFRQFEQQGTGHRQLRQSIVPHAPYSVSRNLFELINAFDPGALLSVHNEETLAENELYNSKTGDMFSLFETLKIDADFFQPSGKTSLQTYLPWLSPSHPLILVHNTFMNEEDIALIRQQKTDIFLCLCPNANWYIERKLPPVDLLRSHNLSICLGTDSLASNHELSIWSEICMLRKHFPHIGLEELLKWATWNGALALKADETLGSLEQGKRPGIIQIRPDNSISVII